MINYLLEIGSADDNYEVKSSLLYKNGTSVESCQTAPGQIKVPSANLWWPIGMNESVGYLYTLQVSHFL